MFARRRYCFTRHQVKEKARVANKTLSKEVVEVHRWQQTSMQRSQRIFTWHMAYLAAS